MSRLNINNDFLQLNEMYDKYLDSLTEGIKRAINDKFTRAVEIGAYVGEPVDPEVIRIFLRSVKVKFTMTTPPRLEIEFNDDFGHWYDGELPAGFKDVVNGMMTNALKENMVL